MREIEVRPGDPKDVRDVAKLMDLNGLPRTLAAEEAFLVAESEGEILAVVEYRFGKGRLLLGRFVADPFVREGALAEALYREARVFARRAGLREVVARSSWYGDFPRRAGYRRRGRGWTIRTDESAGRLPESGWKRVRALRRRLPVPFFREAGR